MKENVWMVAYAAFSFMQVAEGRLEAGA
jgi:hypothetical protein